MKKSLGIVGLLLVTLIGCTDEPVSIKVDYLGGHKTYPTQPIVSVLQSLPGEGYVLLARMTATGAPGITQAQVIGALQQKAQALGANAIVVTDQSENTPDQSVVYNPAGGQYAITPPQIEIKFAGLAIVTQ